jgi:molecular chaperone IbpA
MAMRTLDFSPLFRSTIGFDRMMDLLQASLAAEPVDGYPPYDIVKTGEDSYRITMAIAGFRADELSVAQSGGELVVGGSKPQQKDGRFLHRGIAARSFRRRFELAEFVTMTGAFMQDGLLAIELVRELPETMLPRRVEIVGGATPRLQVVDGTPREQAAV